MAPEVRLIGVDKEQLGIVSLKEALEKASEFGSDLVEISPNAEPPVCRILDYGKYLFEQKKEQANRKKKVKRIQVKEIKFRPTTEEGDYQVKLRNVIRFLEHGDRVKISMRFRGREMSHRELGLDVFKRIKDDLVEHGTVDQDARLEGRQLVMMIIPPKKG